MCKMRKRDHGPPEPSTSDGASKTRPPAGRLTGSQRVRATQLTLDSLPIASYKALSVTLETSGDTSRTPEEPRTARSAPAGARWTLKGSGHSSQLCLPIASYTALSVTLEKHLMTSGRHLELRISTGNRGPSSEACAHANENAILGRLRPVSCPPGAACVQDWSHLQS